MVDYEKVTKGLEICTGSLHEYSCSECPYYNDCARTPYQPKHFLLIDAFDLLKEREPRMVVLDEIKDGESYWLTAGKEFTPRPVICVHLEDDARKQYVTFAWQYGTITWGLEEYGKTWCCWTSRPTDAQREAVKWG